MNKLSAFNLGDNCKPQSTKLSIFSYQTQRPEASRAILTVENEQVSCKKNYDVENLCVALFATQKYFTNSNAVCIVISLASFRGNQTLCLDHLHRLFQVCMVFLLSEKGEVAVASANVMKVRVTKTSEVM